MPGGTYSIQENCGCSSVFFLNIILGPRISAGAIVQVIHIPGHLYAVRVSRPFREKFPFLVGATKGALDVFDMLDSEFRLSGN